MKLLNNISKTTLACFIAGLLMTTLTPVLSRHFHFPDFLKGFIGGLGIMLEVIAIIKISRANKGNKCRVLNG
jgi:hypothetical protein